MTEIIYHDDFGPAEKVRQWSQGRLEGVVFEEDRDFLKTYAEEHTYRAYDLDDNNETLARKAARYRGFLEEMRIRKITHATLHLACPPTEATCEAPRESRVDVVPVDYLGVLHRQHVAAAIENLRRLARKKWLAELCGYRLVFDSDLIVSQRRVPASGNQLLTRVEFPERSPWATADLHPLAAWLLERLLESETIGEWVERCRAALAPEPVSEEVLERFLGDAVRSRWLSLEPPAPGERRMPVGKGVAGGQISGER